MEDLLHNPVYNALLSGDRHLSFGNDQVKFFDEQVSPFAGFETLRKSGGSDETQCCTFHHSLKCLAMGRFYETGRNSVSTFVPTDPIHF